VSALYRKSWIHLSAALMTISGALAAEEKPATTPPANTAAQQALEEYAKSDEMHSKGRVVAGNYHYELGKRALMENRVDDAVKEFTKAVDYMPDEKSYREAMLNAAAIAGTSRDPRSTYINEINDQYTAEQQALWIEAQRHIEAGTKHMESGDYQEASRSFQLALIRLESLPFADERKEPEERRVQALIAESSERRGKQELQEATNRTQSAQDRQREKTEMSLRIERDRIDAMLSRAIKARERRDYDEAILLLEQILKINRAEERAHELLVKCRRERHVYLRQVTADRWDEEHKLLSEQIRASMLPQLELMVYSHDWPEIDARRSAPVRGLQAENDEWQKSISESLEQNISMEFQDHDLVDVVAFLQRITNVNIILDQAVVAAGARPVTLSVASMKLKNVLDYIMRLTELNYVMRDEAIYISDTKGVRGDTYLKLYDIHDLTHGLTSFPGPDLDIPEPGGTGSRLLPPIEAEESPELNEFIDIVRTVVSPATWEGENISIEEYQGSMAVSQTADVHREIDQLLHNLRNQRGTQIHVKVKFLTVNNDLLEEIGVNWNQYHADHGIPPGTNPAFQGTGLGGYNADGHYTFAGALNNQMLGYTTSTSLPPLQPDEGARFQTETFHFIDGAYASAVLRAIEKEDKGNILFEPDLTLFNGQQAHLVHMNQQSYVADYDVVQGQYDPITTILSYGTVLDVTAVASADKKYIQMTLRPTNTSVVRWRRFGGPIAPGAFPGGQVTPAGPAIAAGGNGQNPLMVPELIYQSARTSVQIPDGGSIMIAGMNNSATARSHSGIPFLSHIPFLGRLFSRNGRIESERKTLIIVQADLILFDEIEDSL
jgi:type II secretory pathway component GspD/PulD (secretin)